jgi:hypothetical protein
MTNTKKLRDRSSCPLCKETTTTTTTISGIVWDYNCRICGKVSVHEAFDPDKYSDVLHLLSGWTRERTENNSQSIPILPEDIDPSTEGLSVKAIISLPSIPKTIDENIGKFLEALKKRSRFFGDEIRIATSYDYTLAYLEHFREDEAGQWQYLKPFLKFLGELVRTGYISQPDSKNNKYELKIEGLRHLEKIQRKRPESFECFIAMKFGDKLLDRAYHEAMVPAILEAGYKPIQMAYLEHNNNIIDEMLGGIKRSSFMVADLSFQNQNVYFEAGFAQGLGIPVIYTCHDYHAHEIKFDTQHTNQIRWSEIDELRVKLKNRILATIS